MNTIRRITYHINKIVRLSHSAMQKYIFSKTYKYKCTEINVLTAGYLFIFHLTSLSVQQQKKNLFDF